MFRKLLIANRGEIACRVMRTASRMGLRTVAVYSDADAEALHAALADEAVCIGPPPARDSYLNIPAIVDACRRTGADAVHPGYGFLSENAAFAEALHEAGIAFIGPPAEAIRAMGLKDGAKRLMEQAGVPVIPGYHGDEQDPEHLAMEARRIGFPVLIKARAGGGGKGMRRVDVKEEFAEALESACREAESAFGDERVLLEKYIGAPRHIEVQVFADTHGNAVHLFERDCSLQRRHQKVIEEAPAPGISAGMRAVMGEAAVRAARSIGYVGAGTVEYLVDPSEGLRPDRFYFMEMNTRLQVEHPVTEAITGLDLVELQLRVAAGDALPFAQDDLRFHGHAFEARLYAEDPARGFLPTPGTLRSVDFPDEIARIDSGVRAGDSIAPHYDPMIAKVIVHDRDRDAALARLALALDKTRLTGTVTNLDFLRRLVRQPDFMAGDVHTALIDRNLATLVRETDVPRDTARAVAALAALGLHEHGTERDPWAALTGWRAWGPAQHHALFEESGAAVDATVLIESRGRYRVRIGEVETSLHPIDDARMEIDGIRRHVRIEADGHTIAVQIEDASLVFRSLDPLDVAVTDAAAGDAVLAPMPGAVRQLAVEVGAEVGAGQTLLVLEAMKMEHALKAPRDGIVESIATEVGAQVEEGAVLITLEG